MDDSALKALIFTTFCCSAFKAEPVDFSSFDLIFKAAKDLTLALVGFKLASKVLGDFDGKLAVGFNSII